MTPAQKTTYPFPLRVNPLGRIVATGGDEAIRAKIIQVLFTAPGERINKPEFGCGLFKLVFEPNNLVLAAAMEFTIVQALSQWLEDDLFVDLVNVRAEEELVFIEVFYTRRRDRIQQAVRIQFK